MSNNSYLLFNRRLLFCRYLYGKGTFFFMGTFPEKGAFTAKAPMHTFTAVPAKSLAPELPFGPKISVR
jgi:hypothetical protein